MHGTLRQKILGLALFSVAMAFLESAVVVYLRALLYPAGFLFPLVPMPDSIALTEIFREIATLVMLLSLAYFGGKYFLDRFAWFIYCFAIWDIFYYIFLKILIDWPESWVTWDILFLIPVVWTGPVIAPVIASLTMICMAFIILLQKRNVEKTDVAPLATLFVFSGALFIFLSFIWDFSSFILRNYSLDAIFTLNNASDALLQYMPHQFNWFLFILGEAFVLAGIGTFLILKNNNEK